MTINHVTLAQVKDDADDRAVEEMFVKVRALLREIPGVIGVTGGRVFASKIPNVTHAAVTTLEDRAALDVFATHPKHNEARALMGPFVQGGSNLDYEIDEP